MKYWGIAELVELFTDLMEPNKDSAEIIEKILEILVSIIEIPVVGQILLLGGMADFLVIAADWKVASKDNGVYCDFEIITPTKTTSSDYDWKKLLRT